MVRVLSSLGLAMGYSVDSYSFALNGFYFLLPQRQPVFSPFFQHMKINTAVKKTTYTIKNPTLLADPVTLLLPIKISKIYDKSTLQPCQVIGKPHPNPYFFAGNQIFLLSSSISAYHFINQLSYSRYA